MTLGCGNRKTSDEAVKGQFFLYMIVSGLPRGSFFFFMSKFIDAEGDVLLCLNQKSRRDDPVRRSIILNKLSKVLTAMSVGIMTTVPVLADGLDGIVGADFGGIESFLMAGVLLVFGFLMSKFW